MNLFQKNKGKHFLLFAVTLLLSLSLFTSCGKHRKNFVAKFYHNTTSLFNGYYNANVLMKETSFILDEQYKFTDEGLMSVFYYGTDDEAKSYESDFETIIEKNDVVMIKHPNAGYVDKCRFLNGKSHFFKRNYSAAIANFQYVIDEFPDSKLIPEAWVWIAKTQYESGLPEIAVDIVQRRILDYDTVQFRKKNAGEAALFFAQLASDSGNFKSAAAHLLPYVDKIKKRHNRAQTHFLLAQLYDADEDFAKSLAQYEKVAKVSKTYELAFQSKMKVAGLYAKYQGGEDNNEGVYAYLNKLLKDDKNEEYVDQIYFQFGLLALGEDSLKSSIKHFKKTLEFTVDLRRQALASYHIGNIFFTRYQQYDSAQVYFDAAASAITKTAPEYEEITRIAQTLREYVTYKTTITYQDSMIYLATLTPEKLDALINKIAKAEEQKKAEEERIRKEKLRLEQTAILGTGGRSGSQADRFNERLQGGSSRTRASKFYFDNPAAVSQGIQSFQQKWGQRANEDDWRRIAKGALFAQNNEEEEGETAVEEVVDSVLYKEHGDKYKYYVDIPINDSLIVIANSKIETAIFKLAQLYEQKLSEPDSAIRYYEWLLSRYSDTEFALMARYALYNLYHKNGNPLEFVHYNYIVNEHPNTIYAYLLLGKDPAGLQAAENDYKYAYTGLFASYRDRQYETAIGFSEFLLGQFGEHSELDMATMKYIRAMSYGYLGHKDSLMFMLTEVVRDYPKADVTPVAQRTLAYMKDGTKLSQEKMEAAEAKRNKNKGTKAVTTDPSSAKYKDFSGKSGKNDKVFVLLFIDKTNIKKADADKRVSAFNKANFPDKRAFTFQYKNTHILPYVSQFASINEAKNYIFQYMADPEASDILSAEGDKIFYISHPDFKVAYGRKRMEDYIDYYKNVLEP